MRITIVGTGYVGLVSGTCFAETGNSVLCVDNNIEKVNRMLNGEVPIYEPGLESLFTRNIKEHRLNFTTQLSEGLQHGDIIFLALPTPPNEDGSADLQYILKVAKELGKMMTSYKVIVNKSTVPVGTAKKVKQAIRIHYSGDFDVVSNPEFLREGAAIEDFMKPDRVIIGTKSEKAKHLLQQLYEPFVRQGNIIYFMDERSSEMTKYAANSYLAMRISYMNEIANLCSLVNADVEDVRRGMGSDNRIGKRFLFSGIGYGGSCFPKDVLALATTAHQNEYDFKILKSVIEVNELQKHILVQKILTHYHKNIINKHFALWGLAFKPNTDDIREAPALIIIQELLRLGATITCYDPEAMNNAKNELGHSIQYAESPNECLKNADALIIATEWNIFRTPDFEYIKEALYEPLIFDGRNLFSLSQMHELGFTYYSIGRKVIQ